MKKMLAAIAPAVLAMACGAGNDRGMMGASPGAGMPGANSVSVTPPGGATGVSPASPIVFRFGAAMGTGMEQYVDLHMGDLAAPNVPMNCGWAGDRTTLTCTPQGPLSPRSTYVVHLGGGMMTQAGHPLDYGQGGPPMGGQWIVGGMMGPSHAGGAWGMMGPSWRHANGSYGMAFSFTTA